MGIALHPDGTENKGLLKVTGNRRRYVIRRPFRLAAWYFILWEHCRYNSV